MGMTLEFGRDGKGGWNDKVSPDSEMNMKSVVD